MAKKLFTNKSRKMAAVHFEDGSSVYIKSGRTHESDKDVAKLDVGIVEKVIKTTKILGAGKPKKDPIDDAGDNK